MNSGLAAVFFDRDGVLNRAVVRDGKPYPPISLEEVVIIPGVAEALKKLTKRGFVLIGVTNQPDVARGTQDRATVDAINEMVRTSLDIRQFYTCCHDDADHCECRKPKPGLILQAAREHGLDLAKSWMVGDRWKDIAAGKAAGLKTVFIDYQYAETYWGERPDHTVRDTVAAVQVILYGME